MTGLAVDEIGEQLAGSKSRTAVTRQAEMLFAFANEIAEGDAIIVPDRARRQVVVGRVTGPYEWVESAPVQEDRHTRAVSWNARFGWDDLPEPVKHTVLHYQRAVLRLEDQDSAIEAHRGRGGHGDVRRSTRRPTAARRDRRSISGSSARAATNASARRVSSSGRCRSSPATRETCRVCD